MAAIGLGADMTGGGLWVIGLGVLAAALLLALVDASALVVAVLYLLHRYMRQASFLCELRLRQDTKNAEDYGTRALNDATAANRIDEQPDKGETADGDNDKAKRRPSMSLTSDVLRGEGMIPVD